VVAFTAVSIRPLSMLRCQDPVVHTWTYKLDKVA
jgi:hypothetical protein